ncbi:hypothetical protein AB0M36_36185 [Actinoplanes sp. NPDC051346]|uniref:hypothetical protein n=1 Tax=Actinoplanes sp. NPDC051346 TaxID=3155048 RepID=UPI003440E261
MIAAVLAGGFTGVDLSQPEFAVGEDHIMSESNVVAVDLTEQEWYLLRRGMGEWGGSASPTDEIARVLGFASEEDLLRGEGRRLREALKREEALSWADWRRALFATEVVFASAIVGAGWDWSITTGLSDEETIGLLRAVQGKVFRAMRSA